MSCLADLTVLDSPLGKRKPDSRGALISGVRMDTARAYAGVPGLLQKVINEASTTAWADVARKIDYMYVNLDHSLSGLNARTGFGSEVQSQVRGGKKLLFKPNLVAPNVIDPATHGEGLGAPVCTEWPLVAAIMRWFHDKLEISYHQMALGEGSASTPFFERYFSLASGKTITSEAIIEGKSDDFYGGWGFYFVRKYLSEYHPPDHSDDPMSGYAESVAGRYLPPGRAGDKLMVYDLNKLHDDPSKSIDIAVPEGANYKEISLHKVVLGGDPRNPEDMRDYPGSVLINIPKLKIHAQDLITNAIKNLGIGLYPMQASCGTGTERKWKYSCPVNNVPCMKGQLPHMPWVVEVDEATNLPLRDENGNYLAKKTAGMPGTQADVIKAVQSRNVFMVHIVDAIDTININHNPEPSATRVPEGFVWSSLDCVALDLFCARYCFKTLPTAEALKLKEENGWPTEFVHHVPVARTDGTNIITEEGLDSPLFRYNLYRYAERRGIGKQEYYVLGRDTLSETALVSLDGHLGRVEDSRFEELMTGTMYYNPYCLLWDMQKTVLSYAEAHDRLTGSSLYREFMDSFDENHDGMIDYDENGKKGYWSPAMRMLTYSQSLALSGKYGALKSLFYGVANLSLKPIDKNWNPGGHDFAREYMLVWIAARAFVMSQSETVSADPFVPGLNWGKGMWPSWRLATRSAIDWCLYGSHLRESISLQSLYGAAFQYADKVFHGGAYTGSVEMTSDPTSIDRYFNAVPEGVAPLAFVVYVPAGYASLGSIQIPNVEETEDPGKIFTAHFNGGTEVW